MSLEELINLKLKNLNNEMNRIHNDSTSALKEKDELELVREECEDFIHLMSEGWENIVHQDTETLTKYLIKYNGLAFNEKEINENFKIIKLVFEAIDAGLDTTLTETQVDFIRVYIGNLMQMVKDLDQKIKAKEALVVRSSEFNATYSDVIIGLEILSEKISDPLNEEVLDENDFQAFYSIIEDKNIPNDVKKQAIVKFIKYNSDRMSNTPKQNSKVNIDDIKDLFSSFGINDPKVLAFISRNKKELEARSELQNMNSILSFMKENNILWKFDISTILSICLAGSVESVRDTYKKLEKEHKLCDFYFQTPGVWVNNALKQEDKRPRYGVGPGPKDNPRSLYYAARKISLEDVERNEEFLKEKGFNIDLESKENIGKLLSTPHYRLVQNYEICKKYGLYQDESRLENISPLYGSCIDEKMDKLTEVGLFNCDGMASARYGRYANYYPSAITKTDDKSIAYFSYLRSLYTPSEYYGTIFSEIRSGMLKRNIIPKFGKEKGNFEGFLNTHFINADIPNSSEYDKIISESNAITYDEDVFHEKAIFDLERQFRVRDNEFLYNINGVLVSRLKVLRTCSILKNAGVPINSEQIMYAITKGMFLTEKSFDMISAKVGYSKEGEMAHGLL